MKADIETALAAAKCAGRTVFLHTHNQTGGEFAARDLTAGDAGLIGRDGTFIPYRMVASIFPQPKPGRRAAKEREK